MLSEDHDYNSLTSKKAWIIKKTTIPVCQDPLSIDDLRGLRRVDVASRRGCIKAARQNRTYTNLCVELTGSAWSHGQGFHLGSLFLQFKPEIQMKKSC